MWRRLMSSEATVWVGPITSEVDEDAKFTQCDIIAVHANQANWTIINIRWSSTKLIFIKQFS